MKTTSEIIETANRTITGEIVEHAEIVKFSKNEILTSHDTDEISIYFKKIVYSETVVNVFTEIQAKLIELETIEQVYNLFENEIDSLRNNVQNYELDKRPNDTTRHALKNVHNRILCDAHDFSITFLKNIFHNVKTMNERRWEKSSL